jgi:hypothetical protein
MTEENATKSNEEKKIGLCYTHEQITIIIRKAADFRRRQEKEARERGKGPCFQYRIFRIN